MDTTIQPKATMVHPLPSLFSIALFALASFQAPNANAASLVNNPAANNTGLCLDVKGADVSSGTGQVVAFTCNGTFAQQWTFEDSFPAPPPARGQTIRGLKNPTARGGVSFCLDVFGNGRAAG